MRRLACLLLLALALPAVAQQTAARWIWYPEQPAGDCVRENRWLRKAFDLPAKPTQATLYLTVDDGRELFVNGQGPVQSAPDNGQRFDLGGLLQAGHNALALEVYNASGPAGAIGRLEVKLPGDREVLICTDETWRAAKTEAAGWNALAFDDSAWVPVRVLGSAFLLPWYEIPGYRIDTFITPAEAAAHKQLLARLLAPPGQFAREQPARARIAPYHGAPALFINDRPRPLVMYRGTIDPFTEYGRAIIADFRDAGIHGFAPYLALDRCWSGPGQYDFSKVDNEVRAYLSVDPQAYLDMLVRLVPPTWWLQSHPEEMVRYATSDQIDSGDEAERVLRPSPASEAWRKDAGDLWAKLIRHLEGQPWGKRVIGWHACYGIYAEWHYFGSWTQQYPDTGPAMTKAFRAYLRGKYGVVGRLREAWGDPQVSFETAAVPGVPPRRLSALLSFRDPAGRAPGATQSEQAVVDYYRCQHKVTADAIEYFGKLAKQATGGRAIYGIYYGYFMGVWPQAQGGHLELLRLLKSPYIDYFVAPYDYGNRLMGMDGRLRSLVNVFNLAGKAHIIEADTRTYLHSREEYGRTQNLTESLAAVRREFSTGLVEHTGYWYVDFGPDSVGGWFHEPHLMDTIGQLYRLAERAQQAPRRSVAEVALVCDLDSAYYLSDGEGMATAYRLIMDTTGELYRTGVPFDALLLPQLATADLSRYKALIFLNATAMTEAQAAGVRKLRESGKRTTVFLWAPGVTGPEGLSAERVRQATGFAVKVVPTRVPGRMVVTQLDDPLTAGLPVTPAAGLRVTAKTPVAGFDQSANWYNPRDKVYMEDHYQQFAFTPAPGGLDWTFETTDAWTDLHWQGEVSPPAGLGLQVGIEGNAAQLNLTCVIKDANLAEFVTPAETFTSAEPRQLCYPLQAFENAPWSKDKPAHPALPLRGMKFVVRGVGGSGAITVRLRNLETLSGEVTQTDVCRFGEDTFGPLVTPVAAPGVKVLGHVEGREDGLLAVRRAGQELAVYCPVPYLPRELLANVLSAAGVHRYDDDFRDVLRADSRFVAIHTQAGGARSLRLPARAVVREALTGEKVGEGTNVPLTLPANSTTILELAR